MYCPLPYTRSVAWSTALARKPKKPDLDIDELLRNAQAASEFLKALSHEARLVILCLLTEGEKSVTEIEQLLKLRQPAVSQQLARLRADDLVETRRDGKNIYYSLARPGSAAGDRSPALRVLRAGRPR